MSDPQFTALRQRHQRMATLFRQLKEGGHLEAAEAAFWTAQRSFDEAQAIYQRDRG